MYKEWLNLSIEKRIKHYDKFINNGGTKKDYTDLLSNNARGKEREKIRKRINKVLESRDSKEEQKPKVEPKGVIQEVKNAQIGDKKVKKENTLVIEVKTLRKEMDELRKIVDVLSKNNIEEKQMKHYEGETVARTIHVNKDLLEEFTNIVDDKFATVKKSDIYNYVFEKFIEENK